MMLKYVTKIKAKVNIYTRKKTSNLFDGSYKSIYQGNGLDFENLREYIPGDSIRDIDWKASSRGGKILVKRYVAEKKHNIMLVFDTGKKMCAHTGNMEIKKDIALDVGGMLGYLAGKNGDNIGALYNRNGLIQFYQLRTGLYNVERILSAYDKEEFSGYEGNLEKSLDYIIKNIKRKMIVFVITDVAGIHKISENTLKRLTCQHDVLFISIGDANLTDGKSFDMDGDSYVPDYISGNKKLMQLEADAKKNISEENESKLLQYRIVSVEVNSEEESADKVIELLGGHRYANNR